VHDPAHVGGAFVAPAAVRDRRLDLAEIEAGERAASLFHHQIAAPDPLEDLCPAVFPERRVLPPVQDIGFRDVEMPARGERLLDDVLDVLDTGDPFEERRLELGDDGVGHRLEDLAGHRDARGGESLGHSGRDPRPVEIDDRSVAFLDPFDCHSSPGGPVRQRRGLNPYILCHQLPDRPYFAEKGAPALNGGPG
jgi:hypothetical protein